MNALKSYCRTAEKETNQDKKDIFLLVFFFEQNICKNNTKMRKKVKIRTKKQRKNRCMESVKQSKCCFLGSEK